MAAARREPPQSGVDTVMTGALSHRGGCGPGFRAGSGWPAGLPGPGFPAGKECTRPRVLQQRSLRRKHTHVTLTRPGPGRCGIDPVPIRPRGAASREKGTAGSPRSRLTPTEQHHVASMSLFGSVRGYERENGVLLQQLRLRADAVSSDPASRSTTASEPARPSATPRGSSPGLARTPQRLIAVPS